MSYNGYNNGGPPNQGYNPNNNNYYQQHHYQQQHQHQQGYQNQQQQQQYYQQQQYHQQQRYQQPQNQQYIPQQQHRNPQQQGQYPPQQQYQQYPQQQQNQYQQQQYYQQQQQYGRGQPQQQHRQPVPQQHQQQQQPQQRKPNKQELALQYFQELLSGNAPTSNNNDFTDIDQSRIEKAGSGAFGTVWKVFNIRTNSYFAFKLCVGDAAWSQFKHELLISKLLRTTFAPSQYLAATACIPRTYYEHEQHIPGTNKLQYCYIWMEFIPATSFTKPIPRYLTDSRRMACQDYHSIKLLDINILTEITMQLLMVTQYLHYKHIIHRDIKPDNVMWIEPHNIPFNYKIKKSTLSPTNNQQDGDIVALGGNSNATSKTTTPGELLLNDDEEWYIKLNVIKLIDFGLSKHIQPPDPSSLTQSQIMSGGHNSNFAESTVGTPLFQAPEMLKIKQDKDNARNDPSGLNQVQQKYRPSVDIFAIGITCLQFLYGYIPAYSNPTSVNIHSLTTMRLTWDYQHYANEYNDVYNDHLRFIQQDKRLTQLRQIKRNIDPDFAQALEYMVHIDPNARQNVYNTAWYKKHHPYIQSQLMKYYNLQEKQLRLEQDAALKASGVDVSQIDRDEVFDALEKTGKLPSFAGNAIPEGEEEEEEEDDDNENGPDGTPGVRVTGGKQKNTNNTTDDNRIVTADGQSTISGSSSHIHHTKGSGLGQPTNLNPSNLIKSIILGPNQFGKEHEEDLIQKIHMIQEGPLLEDDTIPEGNEEDDEEDYDGDYDGNNNTNQNGEYPMIDSPIPNTTINNNNNNSSANDIGEENSDDDFFIVDIQSRTQQQQKKKFSQQQNKIKNNTFQHNNENFIPRTPGQRPSRTELLMQRSAHQFDYQPVHINTAEIALDQRQTLFNYSQQQQQQKYNQHYYILIKTHYKPYLVQAIALNTLSRLMLHPYLWFYSSKHMLTKTYKQQQEEYLMLTSSQDIPPTLHFCIANEYLLASFKQQLNAIKLPNDKELYKFNALQQKQQQQTQGNNNNNTIDLNASITDSAPDSIKLFTPYENLLLSAPTPPQQQPSTQQQQQPSSTLDTSITINQPIPKYQQINKNDTTIINIGTTSSLSAILPRMKCRLLLLLSLLSFAIQHATNIINIFNQHIIPFYKQELLNITNILNKLCIEYNNYNQQLRQYNKTNNIYGKTTTTPGGGNTLQRQKEYLLQQVQKYNIQIQQYQIIYKTYDKCIKWLEHNTIITLQQCLLVTVYALQLSLPTYLLAIEHSFVQLIMTTCNIIPKYYNDFNIDTILSKQTSTMKTKDEIIKSITSPSNCYLSYNGQVYRILKRYVVCSNCSNSNNNTNNTNSSSLNHQQQQLHHTHYVQSYHIVRIPTFNVLRSVIPYHAYYKDQYGNILDYNNFNYQQHILKLEKMKKKILQNNNNNGDDGNNTLLGELLSTGGVMNGNTGSGTTTGYSNSNNNDASLLHAQMLMMYNTTATIYLDVATPLTPTQQHVLPHTVLMQHGSTQSRQSTTTTNNQNNQEDNNKDNNNNNLHPPPTQQQQEQQQQQQQQPPQHIPDPFRDLFSLYSTPQQPYITNAMGTVGSVTSNNSTTTTVNNPAVSPLTPQEQQQQQQQQQQIKKPQHFSYQYEQKHSDKAELINGILIQQKTTDNNNNNNTNDNTSIGSTTTSSSSTANLSIPQSDTSYLSTNSNLLAHVTAVQHNNSDEQKTTENNTNTTTNNNNDNTNNNNNKSNSFNPTHQQQHHVGFSIPQYLTVVDIIKTEHIHIQENDDNDEEENNEKQKNNKNNNNDNLKQKYEVEYYFMPLLSLMYTINNKVYLSSCAHQRNTHDITQATGSALLKVRGVLDNIKKRMAETTTTTNNNNNNNTSNNNDNNNTNNENNNLDYSSSKILNNNNNNNNNNTSATSTIVGGMLSKEQDRKERIQQWENYLQQIEQLLKNSGQPPQINLPQ